MGSFLTRMLAGLLDRALHSLIDAIGEEVFIVIGVFIGAAMLLKLFMELESWKFYAVPIVLSVVVWWYASGSEMDEGIRTEVLIADIGLVWLMWGLVGIGFNLYNTSKCRHLLHQLKQGRYKFREYKALNGFLTIVLHSTEKKKGIRLRILGDDNGKTVVECRHPTREDVEWVFNPTDDQQMMADSIHAYLDRPRCQ